MLDVSVEGCSWSLLYTFWDKGCLSNTKIGITVRVTTKEIVRVRSSARSRQPGERRLAFRSSDLDSLNQAGFDLQSGK